MKVLCHNIYASSSINIHSYIKSICKVTKHNILIMVLHENMEQTLNFQSHHFLHNDLLSMSAYRYQEKHYDVHE